MMKTISQFLKRPLIRKIRRLLSAALPPGDDYLLEWWVNVDDVGEECWAYSAKGIHYFFKLDDQLRLGVLQDINRYVRENVATEPNPSWEDESFGKLFHAMRFLRLKLRYPRMSQHQLYWLSKKSIFERPLRFITRLSVSRWLDRAVWSSLIGSGVCSILSFIPSTKNFIILFPLFLAVIVASVIGGFILGSLARLYIRLLGQSFDGNAFLIAACGGKLDLVEAFLVAGMPASYTDWLGKTALMEAAAFGETAIMRLLIRAGTDVSLRDSEGNTALDHARTTKDLLELEDNYNEVFDILIKAGAKKRSE